MSTTASVGAGARHGIVGPRAVEQITVQEQTRAGAASRIDRFAILDRLVGMPSRTADGRDPIREMNAAKRFAVLLVRVTVRFDQPGHHGEAGRIDQPALSMKVCTMRIDRGDAVALDHEIDVGPRCLLHTIDETRRHAPRRGLSESSAPRSDRSARRECRRRPATRASNDRWRCTEADSVRPSSVNRIAPS